MRTLIVGFIAILLIGGLIAIAEAIYDALGIFGPLLFICFIFWVLSLAFKN